MSSLRRLLQSNNAASASPRSPQSGPASPAGSAGLPITPRNTRPRPSFQPSPDSFPSQSSSIPFDWEAARSRHPPPYSTPQQKRSRGRQSASVGTPSTTGTPARKGVLRKKTLFEKLNAIPDRIAFEVAVFPNNVPLPTPKTSAWLIGGTLHFIHLCVRVSQASQVPDSDLGWEDMYREGQGDSWFDWTLPTTFILICISLFNALYLFTRVRLYRLHRRHEPVTSPNAKFVPADLDFEPLEPPSLSSRLSRGLWYMFIAFWRFLFNMAPASSSSTGRGRKASRVQQLEIWAPGELETMLFCVYSPVHAFLWMATGSNNWMLMVLIMGSVGLQLNATTISYQALMKDKEIIHAEVMHEYNEGFVYPRVNPIRKDVAIMTHQSEMVNIWED